MPNRPCPSYYIGQQSIQFLLVVKFLIRAFLGDLKLFMRHSTKGPFLLIDRILHIRCHSDAIHRILVAHFVIRVFRLERVYCTLINLGVSLFHVSVCVCEAIGGKIGVCKNFYTEIRVLLSLDH